jgi:hypothetical protein
MPARREAERERSAIRAKRGPIVYAGMRLPRVMQD